MSNALCHYGVKGMKWGVRRTPEELGHRRWRDKQVQSIVNTWDKKDRESMNLFGDEKYEASELLVYRNIQKIGKTPVAFLDIEDYGPFYNVSIGTRSGEEYRQKGFASKCLKEGIAWYDAHKKEFKDKPLSWWARADNPGSNKLAMNAGFELEKVWRPQNSSEKWKHYLKR